MANKKLYLYPVWIRLWHVTNALMFLILIVTGISLHYAQTGNGIISFQLSVRLHNICAIILTFNYGVFVLGNMFTGNGVYYRKFVNGEKTSGPSYGNKLISMP